MINKLELELIGASFADSLHGQTLIERRVGVLNARTEMYEVLRVRVGNSYQRMIPFDAAFNARLDELEPLSSPRGSL